jgi:hypothetical protein
MNRDDVPKSVRIRTDPADGNAHRYDAIMAAARYWDCNRTRAVALSCEAVGNLVDNVEAALQHPDLPPSLAEELAEQVSTRQIEIDYEGPDVSVDS